MGRRRRCQFHVELIGGSLQKAAIALSAVMLWLPSRAEPVYRVRPPSLEIPAQVPVGQYRRIIHPFKNWTVVCDDNLAEETRVCDIRQEIEIAGAGVIFSWALSASEYGPPVMKMIVPAAVGSAGKVILEFSDSSTHDVAITDCNATSCQGYAPAGPKTQRHIDEELPIGISFNVEPLGTLSFEAPMKGLRSALSVVQ